MKVFFRNKFAVFCVLLILPLSCTTAPPLVPAEKEPGDYSYVIDYMTWLIEKEMKASKAMGLSVALIDGDELVWARGFGYRDKKSGSPADEHTLYKMGSISKVFTATAVMQLAEQGLVDLDAPLTQYIPEFTYKTRFPDAPPVTVRHLMTHHSGLPGDRLHQMMTTEYVPGLYRETVDYYKELYAAYPPDYVHAYCNMGVDMLGILIERVSGMDFPEYMDQHVFTPLEMDTASFYPLYNREDVSHLAAQPYQGRKPGFKWFIRNLPAGALNCSVLELTHFMQMMLGMGTYNGQTILRADTMEEMFRVQNADVPFDLGMQQGLNYFLDSPGLEYAGDFAGHDGGVAFFSSAMGVLREHGLGVIVVTNSAVRKPLAHNIYYTLLSKALEAKTGIAPPADELEQIELSPEELKSYQGYYAINQMGMVDLRVKKGQLRTDFMRLKLSLIPYEGGWFGMDLRLWGLIKIHAYDYIFLKPHELEGKRIIYLMVKNSAIMPCGEEIFPGEISPIWQARLGDYELIKEPGGIDSRFIPLGDFEVKEQDGFMVIPKLGLVIEPLNDYEAINLGFGRGAHETITFMMVDGEEVVEYSGYCWKKK